MKFDRAVSAVTAVLLAVALACPAAAQSARAELKDASGKDVGTAEFSEMPGGVLIKLTVSNLAPGEHAIHVHGVGKCEVPFASAGPHFNPTNERHGMLAGPGHAGDMPNISVPAGGSLTIQLINAKIRLAKGQPNSVFDGDGSALVIHAGPDDYRTDPAGNSGDRIACGVVTEFVSQQIAQPAGCTLYEVKAGLLNISRDPRPDGIFKDVLQNGEVACVARTQRVDSREWGYVEYKLQGASERLPVEGWAELAQMSRLTPDELDALQRKAARSASGAPSPGTQQQGAPTSAPPTPVAVPPDEVLRFDQTIMFGPVPVNGSTIKQLAEGAPLFPPIEGLDDSMWKDKRCTSCHRWDRITLCNQGATYAKDPRAVLRHPHPYGGAYKIALMRWSRSGCQ